MQAHDRKRSLRDVERDEYAQPEPDVPWVALSETGAGLTRRRLLAAARAAGFEARLLGAIGHDLPAWRKRRPTDTATSFFATRYAWRRVIARRPLPPGERGLVAFDVLWTARRIESCWVYYRGWPPRKSSVNELIADLQALAR